MKIKKIIATTLLLSLICVLSGCGGADKGTAKDMKAGTEAVKQ